MSNPEKKPLGDVAYVEIFHFGPWRPIGLGEEVRQHHVQEINGTPHIPVRIYGPKPPEIPANLNRKMSPMPSPISPKKYE